MIHAFSCEICTLLTVFQYASIVQDEIAEFKKTYDVHKDRSNPNRRLEDVYNNLAFVAEKQYGRPLKDNKTVFLFKYEKREFFIGFYDNTYTLGLACYVFGAHIIDFQHGIRKSKYITNKTFYDSFDVRNLMLEFEEKEA